MRRLSQRAADAKRIVLCWHGSLGAKRGGHRLGGQCGNRRATHTGLLGDRRCRKSAALSLRQSPGGRRRRDGFRPRVVRRDDLSGRTVTERRSVSIPLAGDERYAGGFLFLDVGERRRTGSIWLEGD